MKHVTKNNQKREAERKRNDGRTPSLSSSLKSDYQLTCNPVEQDGVPTQLSHSTEWFSFIDKGHKGSFTLEEFIIAANKYLCPGTDLEKRMIRDKILFEFSEINLSKFTLKDFVSYSMLEVIQRLDDELSRPKSAAFKRRNSHKHNLAEALEKSFSSHDNLIPSLSLDPEKWFDHYAQTYGGSLSTEDVVKGLIATLKPETKAEQDEIEESVNNMWHLYDADYTGTIDKWEFLNEEGMVSSLILLEKEWKSQSDTGARHLLNVYKKELVLYERPPSLSTNPEAWFRYFDIDGNGFLSQRELICGLYVSLNATVKEKQTIIRKQVLAMWAVIGNDNSGTISKSRFLQADYFINDIIELEKNWVDHNHDLNSNFVRVKVPVPDNMKPGALLQAINPKTNELSMLMIPQRNKWNLEDDQYFFTVQF